MHGDPDNTFSFSAEERENDPSLVWSFQYNCYVRCDVNAVEFVGRGFMQTVIRYILGNLKD